MKSFPGREAVSFGVLQARLIRFVANRISNGDFSERGLARILQVSQPQLHNVLKGARKLTPELADRILLCFQMTILDLLERPELTLELQERELPLSATGSHSQGRLFLHDQTHGSERLETPKKRVDAERRSASRGLTKTA